MSLFGIKPVTESTVFEGSQRYMGETVELDEILFEAAKDIHQIQGGLYVADIMMESQVIYEGASEEVLLEGVVKDFFDKLIEAFRKLWNKIKAWFKQVYKSLQILFANGETLVKKFGNELHQKESKGYSYNGYKWNKGKVKTCYNAFSTIEKHDVKVFGTVEEIFDSAQVKPNAEGKVTSEEVKKAQEAYIKQYDNRADNLSEFKENFLEDITNGEKEEIEDFSVYSVSEMIAFLKDSKKLIASLEKSEKRLSANCENTIKGFNNLKNKLSTEDKAKYSSSISNCSSLIRSQIALQSSAVSMIITVAKKQNSEFTSALKGLLRYKPAKEGFGYMGESNSSLLESAMGLI